MYSKLVTHRNYVSYAVVFRIIEEEKMIVSGDSYHFVARYFNGDVIEVAYDFAYDRNNTFYLKSNDKTVNFSNSFKLNDIKDLCGLNLEVRK